MNKVDKVLRLFMEGVGKTMTLYHGSEVGIDEFTKTESGIWFVSDPKSEIFDFYKDRGNIITVSFKPNKKLADFSAYDVDDDLFLYELDEFIFDILVEFNLEEHKQDASFKIEEDIYPREEGSGEFYTTSEVLNYLIKHYIIPLGNGSGIIINESEVETVVVFDHEELTIIS